MKKIAMAFTTLILAVLAMPICAWAGWSLDIEYGHSLVFGADATAQIDLYIGQTGMVTLSISNPFDETIMIARSEMSLNRVWGHTGDDRISREIASVGQTTLAPGQSTDIQVRIGAAHAVNTGNIKFELVIRFFRDGIDVPHTSTFHIIANIRERAPVAQGPSRLGVEYVGSGRVLIGESSYVMLAIANQYEEYIHIDHNDIRITGRQGPSRILFESMHGSTDVRPGGSVELALPVSAMHEVSAGRLFFRVEIPYVRKTANPHDIEGTISVPVSIDVSTTPSPSPPMSGGGTPEPPGRGPHPIGPLMIQSGHGVLYAGAIGDVELVLFNTSSVYTVMNPIITVEGRGSIVASPMYIAASIPPQGAETVRIHLDATAVDGAGHFNLPVLVVYNIVGPDGRTLTQQSTGHIIGEMNLPPTERPTPSPPPRGSPAPDAPAILTMVAPRSEIIVNAGQGVSVGITLQNDSHNNVVGNLTVYPEQFPNFRNQFSRMLPVTLRHGERHTFYFMINPQLAASVGDHRVPFAYSYTNIQGRTIRGRMYVDVVVEEGAMDRSVLVIDDFRTSTDAIRPGDTFTMYANITNIGHRSADTLEVTVSVPGGGLTLLGANTQFKTAIPAGSSVEAAFTLIAPPDMTAGAHGVNFNLTYTDGTFSGSYFINVGGAGGVGAGTGRGWLEMASLERTQGPKDAGDTASFYLVLANTGEGYARNVRVSMDLPEDLRPLTPDILLLPEIAPSDAVPLVFRITPTNIARSRTHLIPIEIQYESGRLGADGRPVVETFVQYTSVDVRRGDGVDDSARLIVERLDSPGDRLRVGQSGTISMTLRNPNDVPATNIRIEGIAPSGVVPTSANVQTLPSLGPGEAHTVTFSFAPNHAAMTQTYMVRFEIAFETGLQADSGRERETVVQYGSINAFVPEAATPTPPGQEPFISVPRIILSEYRITSPNEENPSVVLAGQEFDMYLRIWNTHSDLTVSNIMVSLTVPPAAGGTGVAAGDNVFSPVHGSNSFFIPEIRPGQEHSVSLRMFCLNNAAGRNYVMRINFEYEDSAGRSHSSFQEVGITVRQPARLELLPINFPSVMSVGEAHHLSFAFRNVGFVTLRNLMVTTEGDAFDVARAFQIIGNFGIGAFDHFDGTVIALEPGEHTLQIVVTYDLDTGEHIRMVEEAVVTITEGFGMDDFGMGMMGDMGRPGAMVVMPGDVGARPGMRPGMEFDMGFDMGFDMEDGAGQGVIGFIDTLAAHLRRGYDYANANVWPWIAIGGLAALIIVTSTLRGVRRRRMYSLED